MNWTLRKNGRPPKPVLLVIMDGIGVAAPSPHNAVHQAHTPNLDRLRANHPYRTLSAHGPAVGLPSPQDMGNSEVGHNALGAGRIYAQGAKLVEKAIESGSIFKGDAWNELAAPLRNNDRNTLHLLGLLSDGRVHSDIAHLFALLERAHLEQIRRVRVHILLDGRDVSDPSALQYVEALESKLGALSQNEAYDYAIASGGGRMQITMDRYEADWRMVERGYHTHVHGTAPAFASAEEAITQARQKDPQLSDQYLPPPS